MEFDEVTIEEAKEEYRWLWLAFKLQFPSSNHEMIRKMVEVGVAIIKGHVRDDK